ncbi:hypothetical protein Glo7428_0506 [Gloeocapsa sp. PCC 7428]|nr:hypothetical protein Glo7428_0506 [Gloeocapsa sp. PCC 7428]
MGNREFLISIFPVTNDQLPVTNDHPLFLLVHLITNNYESFDT